MPYRRAAKMKNVIMMRLEAGQEQILGREWRLLNKTAGECAGECAFEITFS